MLALLEGVAALASPAIADAFLDALVSPGCILLPLAASTAPAEAPQVRGCAWDSGHAWPIHRVAKGTRAMLP